MWHCSLEIVCSSLRLSFRTPAFLLAAAAVVFAVVLLLLAVAAADLSFPKSLVRENSN